MYLSNHAVGLAVLSPLNRTNVVASSLPVPDPPPDKHRLMAPLWPDGDRPWSVAAHRDWLVALDRPSLGPLTVGSPGTLLCRSTAGSPASMVSALYPTPAATLKVPESERKSVAQSRNLQISGKVIAMFLLSHTHGVGPSWQRGTVPSSDHGLPSRSSPHWPPAPGWGFSQPSPSRAGLWAGQCLALPPQAHSSI